MDILWDYNELYGFIWGTNRKTNTISKQMIQLDHRLESEQDGPRSTSAWWLTYPSEKNMTSSVGMIIPNIWKNKSHVPNHQPEIDANSRL